MAVECSPLSPAGVSGEYEDPAKVAGGGVGFGFMWGDVGEDGRRSRRLQDKSGGGRAPGPSPWAGDGDGVAAAFVAGGEDDVDFVAGGVPWGG